MIILSLKTSKKFASHYCLFLMVFILSVVVIPSAINAESSAVKAGEVMAATNKAVSTLSEKGELSLKRAQQLMDDDSYNYAVDELNRALVVEDHSDIHWFLGRAYSGAGERKLAYFSYRRSYEKDSSNIDVLASLADLVLEFGSISEAEELVPDLKGKLPELIDTYEPQVVLKKADLAYKDGRYIRAFRYFEEVFSSAPILSQRAEDGCVDSLTALAKAYGKSRRPAKGLKVQLKLYQIRPSRVLAKSIASIWKKTGRPEKLKREVISIIDHGKTLPKE